MRGPLGLAATAGTSAACSCSTLEMTCLSWKCGRATCRGRPWHFGRPLGAAPVRALDRGDVDEAALFAAVEEMRAIERDAARLTRPESRARPICDPRAAAATVVNNSDRADEHGSRYSR